MKKTNSELLDELAQVSESLRFYSECDERFSPFEWKVAERDSLSILNLLESEGFLSKVSIEDVFPQSEHFPKDPVIQIGQKDWPQVKLLSFFESRCENIEVFTTNIKDLNSSDDYEGFPLILLETQCGEWIGMAPAVGTDFLARDAGMGACSVAQLKLGKLHSNYLFDLEEDLWETAYYNEQFIADEDSANLFVRFDLNNLLNALDTAPTPSSPESLSLRDHVVQHNFKGRESGYFLDFASRFKSLDPSTLSFASEIVGALAGTKFFVRSLYEPHQEVDRFVMWAGRNREETLEKLLEAVGFFTVYEFEDFSEDEERDIGLMDIENYTSVKPLDEFLRSNLTDLHEYMIGTQGQYYMYVLGRANQDSWIGVQTAAVWT
ncbi:MAG: nuclease A inhibitor family protein [Cyanobacteria bacterium P01_A01_bin.3]